MKKLSYFSIVLFLFLSSLSHAQNTSCSFDEQLARYQQADPIGYTMSRAAHVAAVKQYRASHPNTNHLLNSNQTGNSNALLGGSCDSAKYILPVVIHVIHDPLDTLGSGSNISHAQIQNQLEELNHAFGNYYMPHGPSSVNTGIKFCLAQTRPDGSSFNGVNRIASSRSTHPRWEEDSLLALIHYPTDKYINIFVVDKIIDSTGNNGGVLAYGSYPYWGSRASDLIVIRHDWFGKYTSSLPALDGLAEGKVLAHEMGHYLGLFHPFEGGCTGTNANDCMSKGDMCCDVPAVAADVNGGCNSVNTCFESYSSNPPDQKENYMDYSYPSCKNTFTADQADVMYTTLEGIRSSLWNPTSINSLNLSCCINSAQFIGHTDGCNIDSLNLQAYAYSGGASYTWNFYKNGSLFKTETVTTSVYQVLLDSGNYDVQLTITTGSQSFSKLVENAMTIYKCDSLLPSTQGSWYFGHNAGMRFYDNGLVLKDIEPWKNQVPTQINSGGATLSMSDSMGDLLFYGGAEYINSNLRIFDSDYKQMKGSPILGDFNATQGAVTIPVPTSDSLYYIIHTDKAGRSPFYSIIDISIGIDSIISKNVSITGPVGAGGSTTIGQLKEGLTCIPKCGNEDYWVLLSRYDTSTGNSSIVKLIAASDTITYHSAQNVPNMEVSASMVVSPDGKLVTIGNHLYSFCNSDGNLTLIETDSSDFLIYSLAASFSPNSKLLYRLEYYFDPGFAFYPKEHNYLLHQIDPYAVSPVNTKILIKETEYHRYMQLAPNNKIYMSVLNGALPYVSSINDPNARIQDSSQFDYTEESVFTIKNGIGGMSQGITNHINAKALVDLDTNFVIREMSCFTKRFLPSTCCASSYYWNFGDGTTSTSMEIEHTYADTGWYDVSLVMNGSDTITKRIRVGISPESLEIQGTDVFCTSNSPILYSVLFDADYSYSWTATGALGQSSTDERQTEVTWQDSGILKVVVTDKITECTDSNEIKVYRQDFVPVDFEYSSENCATFVFETSHHCDSSYYWNFGDGTLDSTQNTLHTYSDTGYYQVQLISGGDTVNKSIYVGMLASDLVLTGAATNCDDTAFYNYAVPFNPNHTYTWSSTGTDLFSSTDNSAVTKWLSTGTIEVIIYNTINSCTDTIGMDVTKNLPELDFAFSSSNCKDVQFTTDYYCGLPIKWIFGDSTIWDIPKTSSIQNPINTYATGRTYYASLVVNGDTITKKIVVGSESISVSGLPNPICDTSQFYEMTIDNYNPATTYTWGSFGDSVSVVNDSTYSIKVSGNFTSKGFFAQSVNSCVSSYDLTYTVYTGLPFMNPQITGTTIFCDTSKVNPYSVPNDPYQYAWSVNNNSILIAGASDNEVSVKWRANGQLKVVISDPVTGCSDSATLNVNTQFYNIIGPSLQAECSVNDFTAFDGEPAGIDTNNITYQWFSVLGNINTPIVGATSQSFLPNGTVYTRNYIRKAATATCVSYSNVVTAVTTGRRNAISLNQGSSCFEGGSFGITGSNPASTIGTKTYLWEKSSDSSIWTSLSTVQSHNGLVSDSKVYYRRVATWIPFGSATYCTSTSNVVTIEPKAFIISQPTDAYSCNNATSDWTTSIEVSVPNGETIQYDFEYKRKNTSLWTSELVDSNVVIKYYGYPYGAGSASDLDSFRFYIRTSCGNIYSDIALVRDISATPSITLHPLNTSAQVNNIATFIAGSDNFHITSQYWQVQDNGTSIWEDIAMSDSDTLQYVVPDICKHNGKIRMVVENSCGAAYSNSAILSVTDPSDIWMRDSWKDTAAEPNTFDNHYDIVRSPDMWNRDTADNGLVHQDMEFKNLSPNELYVKVRNKGSDTTVSTPLYLYWTLGQINNEEWEYRWLDEPNNQFYNADSLKDFPMGSRINTIPILVPPIAPGDSLIVSYSWYPPNPKWYYKKDANGDKVGDFGNRLSVCVLARLQHCDIYPYKMGIDEVFSQHVKVNAANNNNIITKNMWVVDNFSSDFIDQDDDGDIDWIAGSWTGMGRQQTPSTDIRPCFDALSPSFFTHWNVAMEVEDVVRDAILISSASNSNITYIGDNIFTFGVGSKCIDEIVLPENEVYFFRPLFSPVVSWASLPEEVFEVGMVQYNSMDEVDGAGSFVLDNSLGELGSIEYATTDSFYIETNHLLLFPNPTNAIFNVELDEETKLSLIGETGSIIVADGYGYPHVILHNISSQDITTINLSGYKAGVFNVRFEIDGNVFYKYVVKTDE